MTENKYLGAGIAIGTALGVSTDHLALWLCLGVAVGAGLDAALRDRKRDSID